jgi:hypothetical protein
MDNFFDALVRTINTFGVDNEYNTPDYILAEYIVESLKAFGLATNYRDKHFSDTAESSKDEG